MSSLLIDDETFARCHILNEVAVDDIQDSNIVGVDKLSNAYLAKCRGSFNLKWDHPHHPTNIKAYEECTTVPGTIPYYWRPKVNEALPPETQNVVIRQPSYVSILPLLISARHYKVDIQKYDIISERNSFRKITMNNEDYVISVQKFGNTVFLRRHDERPDTMNDVGHRFEQLCKPGYNINAFYYQLIEGNVDNLRTLMSGETDAILENEHPIELKCSEYDDIYWKYLDQHWLQTFLNKSWTIIKTWLNPTVQKKVHFIHSADELSEFIDPSVLPKRLNGNQPDFKYIPPTIEDEAMYNAFRADTIGKTIAEAAHRDAVRHYLGVTIQWVNGDESRAILSERRKARKQLRNAFEQVSPYISARTHYHRVGFINEPIFNIAYDRLQSKTESLGLTYS
ncbi:unnamed protein product [Adineta steineri]|uniref:CRAL-TRIO domain-containing protein n=1 Tax=Adineta steineri TaxID=433720 RepID=A0A818G8Z4_9BILA|nr:unnamed protein product [Adineta steineri]CAF3485044.1 unnamed protein product [Adineta steineri]